MRIEKRDEAEVNRIASLVLERVGFFEQLTTVTADVQPGVANGQDDLHLRQLSRAYASFCDAPRDHTYWGQYLAAGMNTSSFRGETAYMWQLRDGNVPLTLIATYLYLSSTPEGDLLKLCTEDGGFGVLGVNFSGETITRDRLDSVCELGFVRRKFGLTQTSTMTILDIGAGYGRLGHRIGQCFPNVTVLCTDAVPQSTALCRYYLRQRRASNKVIVVPLVDVETELQQRHVDIAISVNALSECSARTVQWWLDLLVRTNVRYVVLVPPSASASGREAYTIEQPGTARLSIIDLLEQRGYNRQALEAKYSDPAMQRFGISPTYYHLFERHA